MLSLIPMPKYCEIKDEHTQVLNPTIWFEKDDWVMQSEAFCDSFQKIYGLSIAQGEGGIELHYDASVAENAYRLKTDGGVLGIYASAPQGLSYGLATAVQLCDVKDGKICVPTVEFRDCPDKDYRSIMVDLGREWHPFGKLLKYVDLCFFYKVRYLNLHFADNMLYTLPSKAFPKLCVQGKFYTEEQILQLRAYAMARGVILIPEFECPGHAPVLNTHYPEIFADRSEGEGGLFYNEAGELIDNKALLCASRLQAVEGVKVLIKEICELFPEAPYIHIGGDEANISLWGQCADCCAYMKQHDIEDVYGLYSDYIARIASYVLSLGRTPMVWEGFPEKGSEKIPKETVVISWENHYQTTPQLLAEGFQLINASWKPLYIVPGNAAPLPKYAWGAKEIFEWDVYNWQHWWEHSVATLNPIHIQPTDQVIGAMLCAWEMTFEQEINTVMVNLAALSERTWATKRMRTFEDFRIALKRLYRLSARLIQDV